MSVPNRRLVPHLVAVDMGYGHQRALAPVADLLQTEILNANIYNGIPERDHKRWHDMQTGYEAVSRFKHVPIVGPLAFAVMDYFQRIEPLAPRRNRTAPTWQLRSVYRALKNGWGRDLMQQLSRTPRPILTSFFIPAYMAEVHGYGGEIFLLCCDAEVSRAWAPLNPVKSKIHFLAPTEPVRQHLLQYGVLPHKITVTGFPLPTELVDTLEVDWRARLKRLQTGHPITITYCVGGAGAQREVGAQLLRSLRNELVHETMKINLVAGTRREIADFFAEAIEQWHIPDHAVRIIFASEKKDYFSKFNEVLRDTDVLWTKPSELSFYAGLGIPIIMAAPIGAQERCNRAWLQHLGAGIDQLEPNEAHIWLRQWIKNGRLARAARNARQAPSDGTVQVIKAIS